MLQNFIFASLFHTAHNHSMVDEIQWCQITRNIQRVPRINVLCNHAHLIRNLAAPWLHAFAPFWCSRTKRRSLMGYFRTNIYEKFLCASLCNTARKNKGCAARLMNAERTTMAVTCISQIGHKGEYGSRGRVWVTRASMSHVYVVLSHDSLTLGCHMFLVFI